MRDPVAIYAHNKAQGKCAYCGKRPATDGLVSCGHCRAEHRRYNRQWRARQRVSGPKSKRRRQKR